MRARPRWVVLLSATLVAGSLSADMTIPFDHKADANFTTVGPVTLSHGDNFIVEVTNSDPSKWFLDVTGIKASQQENKEAGKLKQVNKHSRQFRGYRVTVRLIPGQEDGARQEKFWTILVAPTGWLTDINVGLAGSKLVNPEFFLREEGDEPNTIHTVQRDKSAEDEVNFGFATFATVYHANKWPWAGGSLGLAVSDNNLSVLVGATLRVGGRASVTLGYNWAQVDRLPTGLKEGDPFDGDNLVLQTHTQGDWFIAIGIKGFTDVFGKKIAEGTTFEP